MPQKICGSEFFFSSVALKDQSPPSGRFSTMRTLIAALEAATPVSTPIFQNQTQIAHTACLLPPCDSSLVARRGSHNSVGAGICFPTMSTLLALSFFDAAMFSIFDRSKRCIPSSFSSTMLAPSLFRILKAAGLHHETCLRSNFPILNRFTVMSRSATGQSCWTVSTSSIVRGAVRYPGEMHALKAPRRTQGTGRNRGVPICVEGVHRLCVTERYLQPSLQHSLQP